MQLRGYNFKNLNSYVLLYWLLLPGMGCKKISRLLSAYC